MFGYIPTKESAASTVCSNPHRDHEVGEPDVVIKIGSKSFNAHRNILSIHCDYFKCMFASDCIEKNKPVLDLTNTFIKELYTFEMIINYMYAGCLTINKDVTCTHCSINLTFYLLNQQRKQYFQRSSEFIKCVW